MPTPIPTELATRQFILGSANEDGQFKKALQLLEGQPTPAEYREAAVLFEAMAFGCRRAASAVALKNAHEAAKPAFDAALSIVRPA